MNKKILEMLKEGRILPEMADASGAQDQGGTHVKGGEYIDLGPAVVSPTTTTKPDYTKGVPSQALRKLDHAEQSDISGAKDEKGKVSDDKIDEPGDGPALKKGDKVVAEDTGIQEAAKRFLKKFKGETDDEDKDKKDVKEDTGADAENQRQYDKRSNGEGMKHVEGQKDVKEDAVGVEEAKTEIDERKLTGLPRLKKGQPKSTKAEVGTQKSVAVTHIKEGETVVSEEDHNDMTEDINALFAGEELTESFRKKATVIFETAVNIRVNSIVERKEQEITEDLTTQMETAVEEITETLALKVDKYLNYIAEEWVKQNEIRIENTLRADIAEQFMTGLKSLFEQHNIEIPRNRVDLVATLSSRVEELEEKLNVQIENNANLSEENKTFKKMEVFAQVTEGLAASQVDKLKTLSESVEFKNADSYKQSLTILKESNFAKTTPRAQNLTEDKTTDKPLDGTTSASKDMEVYLKTSARLSEK